MILPEQIRVQLSKYVNNIKDIIIDNENYAHRSLDRESHASKALELRDKFSECERIHSIKPLGTNFKIWFGVVSLDYDVERSGNKDSGSSSQGGAAYFV